MSNVNWGGVIAVIVFYLLILLVGLWAGWYGKREKRRRELDGSQVVTSQDEESMLAGRNIGWFVGTFTMTATWVGGGYINGTAEAVYDPAVGLVWTQGPWGYALSLVLGGLLFARVMRRRGYVTLLDPFQETFGTRMGGLLYIPALVGEIFWTSAILAALGATISVMLDLDRTYSVIGSAAVAVLYTLFGGLYSVAYTDVVQLTCIFLGLWLCVPFVLSHEHVTPIATSSGLWVGHWDWRYAGVWADTALLLMFGGIPWQVYFQRVLSSKSERTAMVLSFLAAVGCIIMAIPPVLLGAAARSVTDWREVGYDAKHPSDKPISESSMILPLTIQYLTPSFVGWCGLGAVSAAVMSSADSSVLSASSMFTRNVYQLVFRENAGEREMQVVLKCAIFGVGVVACWMALTVESIFDLWILCSDLVYVVLFPQLFCVIYISASNTYGSITAYIVGLFFRISGGISAFKVPPLIEYPFYTDEDGQLFPFKTLSMLLSFFTLVIVSYITQFLFKNGHLSPKFDIFRIFSHKTEQGGNYILKTGPETEKDRKISTERYRIQKRASTKNETVQNGNFPSCPDQQMTHEQITAL